MYRITGYSYDPMPKTHRCVTFSVGPALEMGRLVGQPCPGGPWKRGGGVAGSYFDTAKLPLWMDRDLELPRPGLDESNELDALILAQLEAVSRPRGTRPACYWTSSCR